MTSLEPRRFLKSRANHPLPDSQPPAWTLLPGAPKPPGLGHNCARMLDIVPVNNLDAPNAGSRDFASAKSDSSKPDIGAAPGPDFSK